MTCFELVGCTGAGKSTLLQGILQAARLQHLEAIEGEQFVLTRAGLGWVRGTLPRTLLIDLIALGMCLKTWGTHRAFYALAFKIVACFPVETGFFQKANILRNTLKKIGIYEYIICRDTKDLIILLDEGTLHTAHYLFVHVSEHAPDIDVTKFATLVPLPDVAIYLRQDQKLLIERTLNRGHKRIPEGSYALTERFIQRAVATFEKLVAIPAIAHRAFVVESGQTISIVGDALEAGLKESVSVLLQSGLDFVNAGLASRS